MDPEVPARLFAGLEPSPQARLALAGAARASLAGRSRGWRLLPEASLHLTLRYFGEVDAARAPALREALGAVAATSSTGHARAGALAGWPPGRPRLLVATYGADPALAELADRLEQAARELGFDPEARAFRPHVTLARTRGRTALPVPGTDLPMNASLEARALVLFRSVGGDGGPRYEALARWPLGAGLNPPPPAGRR